MEKKQKRRERDRERKAGALTFTYVAQGHPRGSQATAHWLSIKERFQRRPPAAGCIPDKLGEVVKVWVGVIEPAAEPGRGGDHSDAPNGSAVPARATADLGVGQQVVAGPVDHHVPHPRNVQAHPEAAGADHGPAGARLEGLQHGVLLRSGEVAVVEPQVLGVVWQLVLKGGVEGLGLLLGEAEDHQAVTTLVDPEVRPDQLHRQCGRRPGQSRRRRPRRPQLPGH